MLKITIDEKKLQDLNQFFDLVTDAVNEASNKASIKYAKVVKEEFLQALDDDDVPGPPLSTEWVSRKASKGFYTSKLQRFGKGSPISYYERIEVKEMQGRGVFVGVLADDPVYDDDGKVKGSIRMGLLAQILEKRWPLWNQTFNRTINELPELIKEELVEKFQQLGAGDAR